MRVKRKKKKKQNLRASRELIHKSPLKVKALNQRGEEKVSQQRAPGRYTCIFVDKRWFIAFIHCKLRSKGSG